MMMQLMSGDSIRADGGGACTLIVADWRSDLRVVVAACAEHARDTSRVLLVPSMLHGIDWVGDPYANVPCARRAVLELNSLLKAANLAVRSAGVGDHDPVGAVLDAVLQQPVDRILVCEPSHRLRPKVIGLAHRARRATGLPVIQVAVASAERPRRRAPWPRLWRGECPARTSTIAPAISV